MVRPLFALALVLAAVVGCGSNHDCQPNGPKNGSRPCAATATPTVDIAVDVTAICYGDPAGVTPTYCMVFPTRTPTPTPTATRKPRN